MFQMHLGEVHVHQLQGLEAGERPVQPRGAGGVVSLAGARTDGESDDVRGERVDVALELGAR